MIRISDVVGSLMKGLSTARVKSDLASSALSRQYLEDPALEAFPVPRTEIRQVEIDLKFSVTETVEKVIDEEGIALVELYDGLPNYVDGVFEVPAKPTSTSPDSDYLPLGELLDTNSEMVHEALIAWLESFFDMNSTAVYTELVDAPHRFGRQTLHNEAMTALEDIVATNSLSVWLDDSSFRNTARSVAQAWAEEMRTIVSLAIDTARSRYFDLDLAIKKDQLINVEPHSMSGVKLTFYVQNYEWVTSRDDDGNVIDKLTLK